MEVIKIGKQGEENVSIMIPFSIADAINLEDGDQVGVKRIESALFLYRMWDMDAETGYNVCKKSNGNGLIVRHNDLKYYFQYGEKYELDTEPYYDVVLEKDLYEFNKIIEEDNDGSRDQN